MYFSLVPILREEYKSEGGGETTDYYHSVAVIKKGSLPNVFNMHDLRGAKACFPKVCLKLNHVLNLVEIVKSKNIVESQPSWFINTNEAVLFDEV